VIGNLLRVVPAPREGDGPQVCQGTKLYVGDQELTGVTRVELVAEVNGIWRAKVECWVKPPADLLSEAAITYPTRWQRFRNWWRDWCRGANGSDSRADG